MEKLTIEQIIEQEMTPRTARFWGTDYQNFTPALAKDQHGDGKRLMYFTSLDSRPYYYIIRVDSHPMDEDEEHEFVESTLIPALEDEFGYFPEDDEEEYPGFPMVCLMTGFSWGFFDEYGNEVY